METLSATTEDVSAVHIYENLYKIKRELIQLSNPDIDFNSKELSFFNPRSFVDNQNSGFEKEKMEELKKSIKEVGLMNPLKVAGGKNIGNSMLKLVGGERRFRCISELVDSNEPVFNQSNGKMEPASKVYEFIDCKVYDDSDTKNLYKHAWSENEYSSNISEQSSVKFVAYLRNCGVADKEILDITGKSVFWLKQTDQVISLDPKTFNLFLDGKINKTVAIELSQLKTIEERHERIESAVKVAKKRVDEIKADLERKKDKVEAKIQETKEEKILAEDRVDEIVADISLGKLEEKKRKILERMGAVPDVVIKSNDLKKASGVEAKSLTITKIEKLWISQINSIIDDYDGEDINVDDARLILRLWDGIVEGERDVFKILKEHKESI